MVLSPNSIFLLNRLKSQFSLILSPKNGTKVEKKGGEMLEALLDREENKCYGKKCSHSEECCKGAACVDIEGLSGTCLPIHGKEFYQPCEKDSDCGAGIVCIDSGDFAPSKTCQLEGRSIEKKGFNESCESSMECHNNNGYCCRNPTGAHKSCQKFYHPSVCIGQLSADAKAAVEMKPRLG
ncbi:prohormone-3 [Trichonephila inaurata madagascariensis]|uniref:Prohormone-3 n=1 Tax=Trichonephila inaurata madagascariensis TaxID=2747483 RepID=A0A8X7BNN3_9ARAC|nr:prohormone-3 [Trichonephila inaurata madagascariensis]